MSNLYRPRPGIEKSEFPGKTNGISMENNKKMSLLNFRFLWYNAWPGTKRHYSLKNVFSPLLPQLSFLLSLLILYFFLFQDFLHPFIFFLSLFLLRFCWASSRRTPVHLSIFNSEITVYDQLLSHIQLGLCRMSYHTDTCRWIELKKKENKKKYADDE